MKRLMALLLLACPAVALAQTADSAGVRILEPAAGQKLAQTYVLVRFEAANPNTPGTPTYRLRLDDREPVETSFSEHTFTGLKPGTHTVTVELIDANGTPINGARAQVKFVSTPPPPRTQESEGPPSTKPRFSGEGKVIVARMQRGR
jgi:hypothetical protein